MSRRPARDCDGSVVVDGHDLPVDDVGQRPTPRDDVQLVPATLTHDGLHRVAVADGRDRARALPGGHADNMSAPADLRLRAAGVLHVPDVVERVRLRAREDITTAAPNTHRPLREKIGALTETVESLLKDPPALKKILLYHVVAGSYLAADVLGSTTLPTVNGQSLAVSTSGGPKVNDSAITSTDIRARNGVIHVIDTVLIPQN